MFRTGFFAFPSEPRLIKVTVDELCDRVSDKTKIVIKPWPAMRVQGLKIDHLIRERIREADFLLADITYPNFNVYYEIGVRHAARQTGCVTVGADWSTQTSQTGYATG